MTTKLIIRPLIITLVLLLIPVTGMQITSEWNWTSLDFIFAGVLIFIAGLAIELTLKKITTTSHKVAAIIAILIVFALIWIQGAVGII
jgi:hypothetical protein